LKIRTILVSQPEPKNDKSHYFDLAEKHHLRIDFRPFIKVEGCTVKEFRSQRITISEYSAVVFTSKTAIDHYFRIAGELKFSIPDTMKYFCTTESIALYLQKYIVYRKRKIFHGTNTFSDMADVLKKHSSENFLVPLSDISKNDISDLLKNMKIKHTQVTLYKTVSADLSDIVGLDYDMLVFFSPAGIKSLYDNFPDFVQNDTKIAAFGPAGDTVVAYGLRLDVPAPTKDAPSMTMAIDMFITEHNKKFK